MLADHLQRIVEGSEKNHNLHYRWLDKNGMPVWINCRGKVIDDKDGIPHYLVDVLMKLEIYREQIMLAGFWAKGKCVPIFLLI